MHTDKSPGPDGFSAGFFQSNWNLVGDVVINATLDFLNNGHLLKEINNTFITLILKIDNPTRLVNFRPISLCNTIYKISSKTLANRLKSHLNFVFSPFQTGFINGRLIQDSVI
ncbi:hypothetical protein LIER_39097 [Lithospermum erythrorhizon]|uniref:Reverse transcriptase domain-containing protein n=1 Tax=Lithospermum erythrorhizon TaxID=34254 RepID=A0AAV3Q9T8_LITER